MLVPTWELLLEAEPGLAEMFGESRPDLTAWLASCRTVLDRYFDLEDPRRLEPADRELYVEALLDSKLLLRGFVDRIDVAPGRPDQGGRLQVRKEPERGLRGQGALPDEVLRPRHLAAAGRRAVGAAADLPRQRRDPALRARRGRPARHRAQGRGGVGGHPARPGDRATGSRARHACATGARSTPFCPTKGGTVPPLPEPTGAHARRVDGRVRRTDARRDGRRGHTPT